ncbi:MAG: S9 family peptidase [Planctomycetota bacterium]|nr:MAG: S9 family peptidase [Planctomycetota bacterium]
MRGVRMLKRWDEGGSKGAETSILFENAMDRPVRLYWLRTEREKKLYRVLKPGETHRQHTFAGHVWLVTEEDDKPVVMLAGTWQQGYVRIRKRQEVDWPPERKDADRSAVSPDGKYRAFIRDGNVWIRTDDGETFGLSDDGTEDDRYVARFAWSPDSKKLVVIKEKPEQEHPVYLIESSPKDQLQPKLHKLQYLKPGDRIAQPRPKLFDVAARKKVFDDDERTPNPWSISRFHWSPDSRTFYFLYNERGHQRLQVIAVDGETGEAKVVIDERSKTFIDYAYKEFTRYLDDTNEILWMSERDGWNHLYRINAETGRVLNALGNGPWVVRKVERVDEEKRQVWFAAGGVWPEQDPYHLHLCRVGFDGSGFVRLTEGDGTHEWTFSPTGKYFIDRWSRVDCPPIHELRRSDDGSLVCVLERADWSRLLASGWRPPERFVAKGRDGKTDIYGIIVRPTNFDPHRKYPVIEKIYAGPQSAYVPKGFGFHNDLYEMAELGFILVQIDGMGTSHRSKAFHDVCWKNLGDAGFPDRIPWIKKAAQVHPEMDLTRVGIYGGSAGGQNALRALLAHGDFYKVAVADCGCHDNRMDKIWWNELWMGWPVGPHYAEQSNVTQAHRLTGKLLLIVGELDRNVDPASTMQVVNALIEADKDFDLLVIPGAGHGAAGTPYGRRRLRDFFVRHLLGVEPRWEEASDTKTP